MKIFCLQRNVNKISTPSASGHLEAVGDLSCRGQAWVGVLRGAVLRKCEGEEKMSILLFLCSTTAFIHFSFFMGSNGKSVLISASFAGARRTRTIQQQR